MRAALSLLPAVLLAVGCADTRTYQIAVRNETKQPITVGVAKDGGKFEPQWAAPEEVVLRTNGKDERGWDSVVVPPGETRSAGPVSGDFSGGAEAILRVYAGDLQLSDVLSISRDSPSRVDVPLEVGRNAIVIHDAGRKLVYERVKLPPEKKK